MFLTKASVFSALFWCLMNFASAKESFTLKADFRNRPPDITVTNGTPFGPTIELIESLVKQQGLAVSWREAPWARSLKEAEFGHIGLLIRHSMNKQREVFLLPILLGYEMRHVHFIASKQSFEKIQRSGTLKNFTIGVLRDSFYSENVIDIIKQNSSKPVNTLNQLVEMLNKQRIDFFPVYNEQWKDLPKSSIANLIKLTQFKESFLHGRYLSIPKKSSAVKFYQQLNCQAYNMRKNDEITAIFIKHNTRPYIQTFDNRADKEQSSACQHSK